MNGPDIRLLLAVSETSSRKALEADLNKWGYESDYVYDCNGIFNYLEKKESPLPGLLILDRTIFPVNGTSVCRDIRSLYSGARPYIILLVDGFTEDDLNGSTVTSADDYIKKPFSNEEVHARINVGIRSINLQNSLSARVLDLRRATKIIRQLNGLLPICSHCKKILDDKGCWNELETYISEHSEAEFSHAICPECLNKFYPEVANEQY